MIRKNCFTEVTSSEMTNQTSVSQNKCEVRSIFIIQQSTLRKVFNIFNSEDDAQKVRFMVDYDQYHVFYIKNIIKTQKNNYVVNNLKVNKNLNGVDICPLKL